MASGNGNKGPFPCPYCRKVFRTGKELLNHMLKEHPSHAP